MRFIGGHDLILIRQLGITSSEPFRLVSALIEKITAVWDGSISKIGWASGAIIDDDAEISTSSAILTVSVTATQLFNFSANRSTQVFGALDTVQPSAMRALVLIRAF